MNNSENIFDINVVLKNLSRNLRHISVEKHIELIFDMHSGIPRKLKGNNIALERLLTTLFTFLYKYTSQKELLLTLETVEDFLYEEDISFIVKKSAIGKKEILDFLELGLGKDLEILNGRVVSDLTNDIHFKIPFYIDELGFRRHYRLPFTSMLKKKVLLLIESENLRNSISTMFKYFRYDVDIGQSEEHLDMAMYDLIMIEDCLVIKRFVTLLRKIQEAKNLKCVLLGEELKDGHSCAGTISMQVKKPITQESIFELIVSLFEQAGPFQNNTNALNESSGNDTSLLDVKALFETHVIQNEEDAVVHQVDTLIATKREKKVQVLNADEGIRYAEKMGLVYKKELTNFLNIFEHSDLYFRKIVNEKSTYKIKEFCIDLEQKSKMIGAESMTNFADIVSLIFVYDKLDLLPIYPGRYHIELQNLVSEIEQFLKK